MKQIIINSVLLMCILGTRAEAQSTGKSVMATSGGSVVITGSQVDWTVGQTRTGSFVAGNYILTEGFHPIYNVATSVQNPGTFEADVVLYPNPVDDKLYVQIKDAPEGSSIIVKDVLGKTVSTKTNLSRGSVTTEINMSDKPSGIYFVELKSDKQLFYTTKLIKR